MDHFRKPVDSPQEEEVTVPEITDESPICFATTILSRSNSCSHKWKRYSYFSFQWFGSCHHRRIQDCYCAIWRACHWHYSLTSSTLPSMCSQTTGMIPWTIHVSVFFFFWGRGRDVVNGHNVNIIIALSWWYNLVWFCECCCSLSFGWAISI